jgi:hypothetical protein
MTANLEELLHQMSEQMKVQFQTLQTAYTEQSAALEITTNRVQALSEELIAIKSASAIQPEVIVTPPEPNSPQELANESGTGLPAAPSTTTTNRPSPSTRNHVDLSERLPDISEFTGKRNQLLLWKSALANKLAGNHDRYPTELARITYARARIAGEPALTLSRLNNEFPTLDSLISWLDKQYGDPNERINAELKLRDLRQGKRPFWKFFTEFRTLASRAEASEDSQYMLLKGAISPELQRLMIAQPEPELLTDYVNLVAKIDEQLRFINNSSHYQQTRRSTRDPDAMDIDAMDYAPVGSEERDRRRRKGLCYKCGSSEHLSPNCKKSLPGQDSRVNRTHDVNTVNQRDARPRSNSRSSRRSPRGRRNSHTSRTSSVDSRESKGRSRN